MTIHEKPKVDEFIGRAPDADPGPPRQAKKQITVTLDPELIGRIDELSRRMGQTRSAVVGLLVFEALETRNDG